MFWLSLIASNVVLASLIALAAWLVQRHLRMMAAARILCLLALVKLLTPPLVSVPLGSLACMLGTCNCGHPPARSFMLDTLPWLLLALWSAGAAATTCIAIRRWNRFQRLIARSCSASQEWQSLAAQLSTELSLRRPPKVLALPGRLPPMVIPGWRGARLLIPAGLMSQLNPAQRRGLLLHELSHIKRRDHWVRLLELAARVAFWWLPIVGLIGRQLRACEEAACDAAVVTHLPHARRDYARLILDVIDFANPLAHQAVPQATAMSAADCLENRLRFILCATQRTGRSWPAAALAIGLACAILPCELHCELVAPPRPNGPMFAASNLASWVDGCEPVAGATPTAAIQVEAQFLALCCPK